MNVFTRSRSCSGCRVALAAALVATLCAPAAQAAEPGTLSPRLAELATPAVRSLAPVGQARRLSLAPRGPGSLLRRGAKVLIDVRFDSGAAAALEALRQAGAEIVHVSRRYQTVTVAAAPASLEAIGELPRVRGVLEDLAPITRATCPSGSVVSQGDAQLEAADARAGFGVDGSGVTVGILSDSFDQDATATTRAAGDVAAGDLPGAGNPCGYTSPVGVLQDGSGGDEGRGMAQIVHDLAPGAAIDFASADNGQIAFADNIRALRNAGASVIVDDASYADEPFFQDGPVAVAVDEVTAAGASYFSAAGNDNLIDSAGRDIASWEAPEFRDEESCPAGAPSYAQHCMDFAPGGGSDPTFGITVEPGAEVFVDLQWAEPWEGVKTDLDAYLLQGGSKLLVESEFPNTDDSIQEPVELLSWKNPSTTKSATVKLAIDRCEEACGEARAEAHPATLKGTTGGEGGSPRLKIALLENGHGVSETQYPESAGEDVVGPTIFGHAGAASAVAVGAVRYNSTQPERFSSRGPVTHYFGPVLGGTEAAPAIEPETIVKPDIVASDCVSTTFFGTPVEGGWRFCGTSAAAPHAGAIAALVRQANPGASAAQVRAALVSTAKPIAGADPEAAGAGLLDAYAAVDLLALPPTVAITKAPPALSRNRQPTIQFSANRIVAFSCSVDGSQPQSCASPYTVPAALSDGSHRFVLTGTDLGGRVANSVVAAFKVDTKAPRTTIASHPRRLLVTTRRQARAVFRFRSSEPGTFVCKVDRQRPRACPPRFAVRLKAGRHTLRVRARDLAGNEDPSAAVFHLRVKRVG